MKQFFVDETDYSPFHWLVSTDGSVNLQALGRKHGCLDALQEAASMEAQGQQ